MICLVTDRRRLSPRRAIRRAQACAQAGTPSTPGST